MTRPTPPRDWIMGVPRIPPPRAEMWDGGMPGPDEPRHPDPIRKMGALLLVLVVAMIVAFSVAWAVGK